MLQLSTTYTNAVGSAFSATAGLLVTISGLILCEMCNRFRSLDAGLIQSDDFLDVYKSEPKPNVTEKNALLIHGLSLMCVSSAVSFVA